MSASLHGIAINPEIDPMLSSHPKTLVNGSQVTFRQYPAVSKSSNSAVWMTIPPSNEVYINRAIMKRVSVIVTLNKTPAPAGPLVISSSNTALRSLPVMRMTMTETISLNGVGFPSSTVYDVYPDILLHYNEKYRRTHPLGAVDPTQLYSKSSGAVNNPLAGYDSSDTLGGQLKRGAYIQNSNITNTDATCIIQFDLIEWLYLPGLLGLDVEDQLGLIRIRNFDVNTTFNLGLATVMSRSETALPLLYTSSTVELTGSPTLLFKFISPPRELIPKGPLRYGHFRMERFPTALNVTLADNDNLTEIVSNNIQLPYVPHYMYCFVRESDDFTSPQITRTNTFARITKMNVMFNNQAGLLASAQPDDLWRISKECGLLDNYSMFNGRVMDTDFVNRIGTCGSLFCCEFGRHLSLGASDVEIGSAGSFNLQVNATFQNVKGANFVNPTLYVIICYDQDLVLGESGEVVFETPQVAIKNMASGAESHLEMYPTNGQFQGGLTAKEFFQKVGDFFKKTRILSTVGKALQPVLSATPVGPVANVITQGLERLGLGEGGAVLSKRELKRLVREL